MPVWNGERHIGAALESILTQSRPPDEIIVVDDGSTDSTSSILDSFGDELCVIHQENAGLSHAQNTAIDRCTSTFITFCDSDDLLTPEAIAVRLKCLEANPMIDAVFGSCEQFVSPEVPIETARGFRFPPGPSPAMLAGTMLARRDVFERFGRFDSTMRAGSFVSWMSRARDSGLRYDAIDSLVLRRRLHESNLSRTTGRAGNPELIAAVREHHRRQRDTST